MKRPPLAALLPALLATGLLGPLAALAQAQTQTQAQATGDYPSRPVRFVVPYPPGGPLDQAARVLAEAMRGSLGQPVVVENRPGAGGNIGADAIAKAAPDGYAIVMGAVATHAINPYLYKSIPYNPNRDFTPITRVAVVPNVLVVAPKWAEENRISSVKDLIAFARAKPDALNYGSGGNGSAGHLAGELFKSMSQIQMTHVPYKGAAPAKMALLGGEVQLVFDNLASATPQIRAKQLDALAVTTVDRAEAMPELPTVAESGIPGFDINTWFGIFAPGGLPPALTARLYDSATAALRSPEVIAALDKMGAKPAPLNPSAFADYVKAEQQKYEKIVRASGATVD